MSDRGCPLVAVACGICVARLAGLVTSSVSGLLRDSAHVRQARSRCLRCCPGMTVTTLGRPPHRAREGHGQHLQIRSLVSDPEDRHADHLGLGAALRAVEPPGDDRPRERPNVFQERSWFTTRCRCYLLRWRTGLASQARSSRVYPAPELPPWVGCEIRRTRSAALSGRGPAGTGTRLPVGREGRSRTSPPPVGRPRYRCGRPGGRGEGRSVAQPR
jgi:hypothetical protein